MTQISTRGTIVVILIGMTSILQAQSTLIPFFSTAGGAAYSVQGSTMLWSSLDGGAASIVNSNTTQMRSRFLLAVPFPARLSGTLQLMQMLGSRTQIAYTTLLPQSGDKLPSIGDFGTIAEVEAHYKDEKVTELDGLRINYPNWGFNLRASQTEPLLRLNVEANTNEQMHQKNKRLRI
ncbi:MAG: hypothetical protein ACYC1M_14355 [Armatimonadota bacterium]